MPLAREKPLTVNWCEPRTVSVTERDHEGGGGGDCGGIAIASGGERETLGRVGVELSVWAGASVPCSSLARPYLRGRG